MKQTRQKARKSESVVLHGGADWVKVNKLRVPIWALHTLTPVFDTPLPSSKYAHTHRHCVHTETNTLRRKRSYHCGLCWIWFRGPALSSGSWWFRHSKQWLFCCCSSCMAAWPITVPSYHYFKHTRGFVYSGTAEHGNVLVWFGITSKIWVEKLHFRDFFNA